MATGAGLERFFLLCPFASVGVNGLAFFNVTETIDGVDEATTDVAVTTGVSTVEEVSMALECALTTLDELVEPVDFLEAFKLSRRRLWAGNLPRSTSDFSEAGSMCAGLGLSKGSMCVEAELRLIDDSG